MSEPRFIILDIESLPNLNEFMKVIPSLGDYPGLTLKASINSVICFGYKVLGESKAHVISAWDDDKRWSKDVNDDRYVLEKAAEVIESADVVVGHNSKRFDWKFIQTRLMKHGLGPLPRVVHIDTCAEAKRNLLVFKNNLNTLSKFLTSEKKLENGGWDLWTKVLNRHKPSQELMARYCKQDVIATEALFKRLRPLINGIPNHNLFRSHEKICCPPCGSTRIQRRGQMITKECVRQRFQCLDCGGWSSVKVEGRDPRI